MPLGDLIGSEWAWAIPGLSAGAFALTVMVGRFLPRQGSFVPILAIFLGFVLFWYVLADLLADGPSNHSFNWLPLGGGEWITWGITVDRLSVIMLGLVTFVALLVQVYSWEYMKGRDSGRIGWYYAVHAMFAAAMLALVLADNLLFLYIAWELVGLGSYLLIGFWWEKRSAAEAAKKAFITTRIGDVGLLIGIILLYRATGTFEISTIFHVAQTGGISDTILNMSAVLLFLGSMGKSAQFPLHVWLPDAMEGPTPVSALIHAATMVAAGVFLIARMLPLFVLTPNVMVLISAVGLFTFAFGGTIALVMTDLKRILAYSTISHLGLMMLALGAGSLGAALFHLVAHGVSKALLFLGAGSTTHGTHETEIWDMGGLRHRMPITAVTFLIGAASLAGVVPLSGFFSKDEVLLGVLDNRHPVFLVFALIAAALSALYMARVAFVVFFGRLESKNEDAREPSPVMTVPLVLLALFAATVGFLAFSWTSDYPGFAGFVQGDQLALGQEATSLEFHFEPWLTVLSAVVALSGVAFGWLMYGAGTVSRENVAGRLGSLYRVVMNKYYVDELYQWVIDRVVLTLSRFIAAFDRIVVNDTGVDGPAWSVVLSAVRLRYAQTGRMYNYGLVMVIGLIALSLIWWIWLI